MSVFSKQDYELINLGVCIKQQAERLGIEHDGVPLEGVVVRIAERARSVVAEEPEWEYGAQHSQGTNAHPSRKQAEEMVAWHAAGDSRKQPHARGKTALVRRRKAGPWVPVKQEGAE